MRKGIFNECPRRDGRTRRLAYILDHGLADGSIGSTLVGSIVLIQVAIEWLGEGKLRMGWKSAYTVFCFVGVPSS
jgi:hypothetical protein